jgi:hypothetical protein
MRFQSGRRVVTGAGVIATVLLAFACRDITTLEQQNPSELPVSSLYVPGNAQLLVNGTIADFQCAYLRYVVGSGLLMDELADAIASTNNFDLDRRTQPTNAPYGTSDCTSTQQPGVYTPLSVARATADTILAHLEVWTDSEVPNRQQLLGQAANYAGFSVLLLGEGMCSAAINLGPELTPQQLFGEAKPRFDKAIAAAAAANDTATLNLAHLGRARVLLDLGDLTNAAIDAANVPDGFLSLVVTDQVDVRRQNLIWIHTAQQFYSTVDTSFRNVTFGGVADPRVRVTNTADSGTTTAEIWTPDKYPAIDSPVPLGRWSEAQLIIAEADVAANNLAGAVDIINVLHSRAGIPAYNGTGQDAAQVKAQVIEERRREMFLEGHRLGDIRRYNLPLIPAPGSPYPYGGTWGTQNCFPLPDVERIHNPNI